MTPLPGIGVLRLTLSRSHNVLCEWSRLCLLASATVRVERTAVSTRTNYIRIEPLKALVF